MVMEPPRPVDPAMLAHYAEGLEETRLQHNPLEMVRTRELLTRHLPSPPATILDVGGGPGVYAVWLAARGYDVHLIDAAPLHVEQARQASAAQLDYPLRSANVGDARALDQPPASVDAVLLLGPLYHLTERTDRLRALREAHRVVRPGGLVFAVSISRFASLLDGLQHNLLDDPAFRSIVERDLQEGQHRPPLDRPEYFTTAYFHHPDELQSEVRDAGLTIIEVAAIEGPAWMARDFAAWWSDADRQSRLLTAIRAVENEPSLFGVSDHLMVVARKVVDSGADRGLGLPARGVPTAPNAMEEVGNSDFYRRMIEIGSEGGAEGQALYLELLRRVLPVTLRFRFGSLPSNFPASFHGLTLEQLAYLVEAAWVDDSLALFMARLPRLSR